MELLSPRDSERELRITALEVDLERYQREPLLFGLDDELTNLAPVQEQAPGTRWILVEAIRLLVRTDVQAV